MLAVILLVALALLSLYGGTFLVLLGRLPPDLMAARIGLLLRSAGVVLLYIAAAAMLVAGVRAGGL